MPPVRSKNPRLVIVLLNAYDRELLDDVGKHLKESVPNGVFKRQYFLANLPVKALMKKVTKDYPSLKVFILGNTNRNFYSEEQFSKLSDKFEPWAHSIIALNLRYFEGRSDEKNINEQLNAKVAETGEQILKDLEELNSI